MEKEIMALVGAIILFVYALAKAPKLARKISLFILGVFVAVILLLALEAPHVLEKFMNQAEALGVYEKPGN